MNKSDIWEYTVLTNREELYERIRDAKTKSQREDLAKWISQTTYELCNSIEKETKRDIRLSLGIYD